MTEYELVVRQAWEDRQYWEERNRQRFARIEAAGPPPGKEEIWKKVQARKRQLGLMREYWRITTLKGWLSCFGEPLYSP